MAFVGNGVKSVVRIGGAVVGGMVGGPFGAAIGSALATAATGGNRTNILRNAVFSGIGSSVGGSAVGSTVGRVFPSVASAVGSTIISSIGAGIGATGEGRKIVPAMMGLAGGASSGISGAMVGRALGDLVAGRSRTNIVRNAVMSGISHETANIVGMRMAKDLNLLTNMDISGKAISSILRTTAMAAPQNVGLPLMAAAGGALHGIGGAAAGSFLGGIIKGDNLRKAGMRAVSAGASHVVGESIGSALGLKIGSGMARLVNSAALGNIGQLVGPAIGATMPQHAHILAAAAGAHLHGVVGAAVGSAIGGLASGYNRRTILANSLMAGAGAAMGKTPFTQMLGAGAGSYMAKKQLDELAKRQRALDDLQNETFNLGGSEDEHGFGNSNKTLEHKATAAVEKAFRAKGYTSIYEGTGLEDKNARFDWSREGLKKINSIIANSRKYA